MPCCRIDSISSSSTSRAKSFRGCNVLGTMLVSSIWCTLSVASDPSLGVTTAGVPIKAPRPLPKPERAMRLRLPEQSSQRKQQSAGQCPNRTTPRASRVWPVIGAGVMGFVPEKQLKKVLTLSTEIVYHGARFQNRQDLLPGRVLCLFRIPVKDKKQSKHDRERERTHPCIH